MFVKTACFPILVILRGDTLETTMLIILQVRPNPSLPLSHSLLGNVVQKSESDAKEREQVATALTLLFAVCVLLEF